MRYGASATAISRHFDHDIQALWEDVGVDQVGNYVYACIPLLLGSLPRVVVVSEVKLELMC